MALVVLSREDVRAALANTTHDSTGTEACAVYVPTGDLPTYLLVVRNLAAGRRLLSDDVAFLEGVATTTARRADVIRMQDERLERQVHEQELHRLGTEAELKALRAQINPHFLFNALTTIGYLIQTTPDRALDTLMRLTGLLRGVLRSDGDVTTLDKELELVTAYLDIERARFERRLIVVIDVPINLREIRIPPLILQPLVENAVRHGISPQTAGGEVHVVARLADEGALLRLTVRDTGRGATTSRLDHGRRHGLGLRNVERRLELQYGKAARMAFRSEPDTGTTVELCIPINSSFRSRVRHVESSREREVARGRR
jgi:LytS/YehU family sensor histidine kinase